MTLPADAPPRPLFVTALAVVVFLLSAVSFASVATGILRWPTYSTLPVIWPLQILIALNAVWGIVWLAEGVGLWRLWPLARRAGTAFFLLYPITILGHQALFTQGAYERAQLPLAITCSLLWVAFAAIGLTQRSIRRAFERKREERDSHDIGPED